MQKRIKILILAVVILTSCATYRRSKCLKEWVDPQHNVRYIVYKYSYFYRSNDSVYCVLVDTVKIDLNHKEESAQAAKEGRKICIDEYGK